MNRFLEFDSLRGIAAVSVLLYHYFYRYNEIYGHNGLYYEWAYLGSLGVQLFFMISGFVILWSIDNIKYPLDFIITRFSRLYPVYWCSVLLTFLFVFTLGLPGREVTVIEALINMTMLQYFLNVPSVDGVYWTLAIELTFYFWIFVIYLSGNLKRVESIFLIFSSISILENLGILSLPFYLKKIFLFEQIPYFIAGICFLKIYKKELDKITSLALIFSLVCIYIYNEFYGFIISLSYFSIFFLVISGKLSFLKHRFLVFFGTISYPLYLVHQNMGYIVINKFYEFGLNPIIGIFVAIVLSLLIAFFLTKYVEIYSSNYIRTFYKNNIFLQNIASRLKPKWLR